MPTGAVNEGTVNTGPGVMPEFKSSSPVIESLGKWGLARGICTERPFRIKGERNPRLAIILIRDTTAEREIVESVSKGLHLLGHCHFSSPLRP